MIFLQLKMTVKVKFSSNFPVFILMYEVFGD